MHCQYTPNMNNARASNTTLVFLSKKCNFWSQILTIYTQACIFTHQLHLTIRHSTECAAMLASSDSNFSILSTWTPTVSVPNKKWNVLQSKLCANVECLWVLCTVNVPVNINVKISMINGCFFRLMKRYMIHLHNTLKWSTCWVLVISLYDPADWQFSGLPADRKFIHKQYYYYKYCPD